MKYAWICLAAGMLTFLPANSIRAEDDLDKVAQSVRWRHLQFLAEAPEDLVIDLPGDASRLRIAEFVYGTPESPRVAVVLAENKDGTFGLYVDSSRDRKITSREMVEGSGALRVLPLAAQQIVNFVAKNARRKVLFRWRAGDSTISVASVTTVDHDVRLEGVDESKKLSTRQIDGDANGLYADTKDLLQIDLNADGRFDPFLETFPFRPVVKVRGERWFVKADRFGRRLQFSVGGATGRVKLVAVARSKQDRIIDLVATLAGEDGSVYSLTGLNTETDLPTGRYAASVLFLKIKPEGNGRPWEFTFSRDRGIRKEEWLTVTEGGLVEFDPIGKLLLTAECERTKPDAENLSIQPRLLTGSGLLINLCSIGGRSAYSGPNCTIAVTDALGNPFGQSRSGFA